jgi:hypothetical protein
VDVAEAGEIAADKPGSTASARSSASTCESTVARLAFASLRPDVAWVALVGAYALELVSDAAVVPADVGVLIPR